MRDRPQRAALGEPRSGARGGARSTRTTGFLSLPRKRAISRLFSSGFMLDIIAISARNAFMASQVHFRISSHLKDIIGRDLVTNEFVAVFELLKNALDARASQVNIVFDIDGGQIWIVDDGKGMDPETISDRWLFVAYSAKADGSEDQDDPGDYRGLIRPPGR